MPRSVVWKSAIVGALAPALALSVTLVSPGAKAQANEAGPSPNSRRSPACASGRLIVSDAGAACSASLSVKPAATATARLSLALALLASVQLTLVLPWAAITGAVLAAAGSRLFKVSPVALATPALLATSANASRLPLLV